MSFAKLHKQIKDWLSWNILFGQQLKRKEIELQWQFFQSSWYFWQSFFWQVMQMHFQVWARLLDIKFNWIIWFGLKKVTIKIAKWVENQSMIKQQMKFNLHLLPTPLKRLRQIMASTPLIHLRQSMVSMPNRLRQSMVWVTFTLKI